MLGFNVPGPLLCVKIAQLLGATGLISSVARWVLFLGGLLALYYIVVSDPDLLRWLLARLLH